MPKSKRLSFTNSSFKLCYLNSPSLITIRSLATSASLPPRRPQSSSKNSAPSRGIPLYRNKSMLMYTTSVLILLVGLTYASVPLYRMFCSSTGFIGTPITDASRFTADKLIPDSSSSRIKVTFTANTSQALQWKFVPEQREVHVLPGETALAFYKAKNTSQEDIIGIATYNVTPDRAGQYFNKIQCFCFEEQKLKAGEEVDMPVFFFLDPEIAKDPFTKNIRTVTLSYTFFKARYNSKGSLVPIPVK
ncbi:1152_t:CDS:2 [Paraglomus occultum]|uniref:1152_t:CDS:1 n=1 Tax=Paraglomus occultum TaxID=144539 RepID=A0A9N9CS89_9GLOM|nr:1152_t:CDS:2 [Paraglomus occultum]